MQDNIIELQDGRKIGFAECGDPIGYPILYFHGFPGSRLEVNRFQNVAISNKFRLIGIDRPGMGLSSINPKGSILSWATDIEILTNSLGLDKFSIVGHSGGAPFIAACAYAIPQRLNAAAIVSGMAPLDNPESLVGMARGQIAMSKIIKWVPWIPNIMMKLTLMMLKNPKMMGKMIKQLPEIDQKIFRDPALLRSLIDSTIEAFRDGTVGPAQEMKLLFNPWGFILEKIACPMTIWHGGLDTQAPVSHAKVYAKLIPDAQLNIIEIEGHHSILKNHIEKVLVGVTL